MRTLSVIRTGAIAATLVVAVAPGARAQAARPSQLATVSQVIANAQIDIRYRRPVAKGRELFGVLVPWGAVWSPSSDTAAVFTTTAALRINGEPLAAGTYSLWTIPEREQWTIIFSKRSPVHHLRYPSESADALRVKATPRTGEHMESLGLYFPMVNADSAQLVLHWGRTIVPIDIRTEK